MSDKGAARVDAISQALTCPNCAYSLRGLPGDRIICPECGVAIDRAALVTTRWTGSWTQAPGYGQLISPVAWLTLCGLPLLAIAPFEIHRRGFPLITASLGAALLAFWFWRLLSVRTLAADDRGVSLSLLAHGLFAGYLAGTGMFIFALVRMLFYPGIFELLIWPIIMIAAVAALIACRRGERYIAGQCIRRYLARRLAVTSS